MHWDLVHSCSSGDKGYGVGNLGDVENDPEHLSVQRIDYSEHLKLGKRTGLCCS